jgi:hypothetical protein
MYVFSKKCQTDCSATQPPIQCVPSALSMGIKWLEHEADHSPPSTAEVKKEWSCMFTHLIFLNGLHRDFTFFFSCVLLVCHQRWWNKYF